MQFPCCAKYFIRLYTALYFLVFYSIVECMEGIAKELDASTCSALLSLVLSEQSKYSICDLAGLKTKYEK